MSSAILRAEHVSKRFRSIVALDDVSIEVGRNEIVGLIGSNGAGKSTLTKVLVGVEKPDGGELLFLGVPVSPRDPQEAARIGISIAYQESAMVPDLRVFEWMYLGREMKNVLGILKVNEMKQNCASMLKELGISCPPERRIRDLPMVTKKMIEIAKAIDVSRKGARRGGEGTLVILDEPTAPLSDNERATLFTKLKEMRAKASFLLISHIIPEVLDIADRIYVLRDGKNAGVFDPKSQAVTEEAVYQAMFGEQIAEISAERRTPAATSSREVMLRVLDLGLKGVFQNVSFEVNKGEIISIDGTLHSGKMEIVKTIAGIMNHDRGSIQANGQTLRPGVRARINAGIGYFSGDRSDELFLIWPIVRNITIAVLESLRNTRWVIPFMDGDKEHGLAVKMVGRLGIQPPLVDTLLRNLSGGNMQKVGLAKWLSRNPDLLILMNPTSGIDTKTKMEIYHLLLEMKEEGRSIILITEDADEMRLLSDRVITIIQGIVSQTAEGMATKIG